jgi:hypothetical protein
MATTGSHAGVLVTARAMVARPASVAPPPSWVGSDVLRTGEYAVSELVLSEIDQGLLELCGLAFRPAAGGRCGSSGRAEQANASKSLGGVMAHPPSHPVESGFGRIGCESLRDAVVAVGTDLGSDAVAEGLAVARVCKP